MGERRVVLTGLVMGESVRWHDDRLWFCDWGAGEVIRVDDARPVVVTTMNGLPFCIDWLPGGDLLIIDGPAGLLLRASAGVEPVVHADLRGIGGDFPWNDIAADPRGNVYVNNIGYQFPGGRPAPGLIAVVTPDGAARKVADGLLFPNGMAVTPDGSTLVVAESHGGRLTAFDIAPDGGLSGRRVWAAVEGSAPDGICFDDEGAAWYADVPNRRCVRVREGGEIIGEVTFDDGAFDCVCTPHLLYAVTADYSDPRALFAGHTGRLHEIPLR